LKAVAASGLTASKYIKVVVLADSDGDGMQDVYEALHNCLSKDVFDSNLDPDGDGFTSWREYLLGTDPCKEGNLFSWAAEGLKIHHRKA
jgi:hypothetical protein